MHLIRDSKSERNAGWKVLAFFRHVGVRALCICLRKVIRACCYLCYLFFPLCVCVCARREPRWVTPGGQAPAHFLPLSCVLQSGEALSPAICLPALGIVIPKYRPVNISLVTATSPPQHTGKKKSWGGKEMLLARSTPLPFPPFCLCPLLTRSLHPFLSLSSRGSDTQWGKMASFYLVLHVICLIKHWRSFNKTELMRVLNTDAPS